MKKFGKTIRKNLVVMQKYLDISLYIKKLNLKNNARKK